MHKSVLRKHKVRVSEPKYLLLEPLPKQEAVDTVGNFRLKCRVYNRSVENVVWRYDDIFIINIDGIRPDTTNLFDYSGNGLNE